MALPGIPTGTAEPSATRTTGNRVLDISKTRVGNGSRELVERLKSSTDNNSSLSIEDKTMSKPQHYPITTEKAIAHYQAGDITAKGLLHFYLNIRLAPGWTLKETQKQICETLGISRAAFYNALSRLKAEGSINWSTPENTKYSITLNQSTITDNQSTIIDDQSTIIDNQSTIIDNQSLIVTREKSEALPDKGCGNAPYYSSSSYQIFINSLSEPERERFLNFVNKKIEGFTKPIASIPDWLASTDSTGSPRFEDYYSQFKKSPHEVRNRELQEAEALRVQLAKEKIYWEAHPQFEEWVQEIAIAKSQTPFIEDVRKLFLAIDPQSFDRSDFWEWIILSRHHIPAAPAQESALTQTYQATSEPLGAHTEESRHSFKEKLKARLEAKKNGTRVERQRRLTTLSPTELANLESSISKSTNASPNSPSL
jgi:hypothetical protein